MRVRVRIEVPRYGFVKREGSRVEYVSPIPCPFNYGCVPEQTAPDGDALDALVLGPRLAAGTQIEVDVHARVLFLDAGVVDDKLVCGPVPTDHDLAMIERFFRVYAFARLAMNLARGQRGATQCIGVLRLASAE